eukprot:TRINITY_DN11668_c0_g1_i1.p1 TRINITY_DN11668_c0_g1~~TRINITY_DN11668_c0_g1_i1.p1  ORF type:complete len:207 (-),score=27.56 TRINITY_DN11668_c0_g1_i1:39-659(-)
MAETHDFDKVKLSKALSWLLRHNAESQGFKLLPGGFLPVADVLKHRRFKGFSVENVINVVETCSKQRFTLKTENDQLLIRANQGHSIKTVEVEMEEITEPELFPKVIHGTYYKSWDAIRKTGLSRMNRQHIHCAAGEPGDQGVISGMRNTCQLYIYIDIGTALQDGIKFFRSSNNVILSPGNCDGVILPKYFKQVLDVKKDQVIFP